MRCERCTYYRAEYRVITDILDVRVCVSCMLDSTRYGLPAIHIGGGFDNDDDVKEIKARYAERINHEHTRKSTAGAQSH